MAAKKTRKGLFGLFRKETQEYAASTSDAQNITQQDLHIYGTGATTVASLMGSRQSVRSRQAIYDQWTKMESDPICGTALSLLVTAALGGHETTGDMVFIEKRMGYADDKARSDIVEEIQNDLSKLLNENAVTLGYLAAAYGDSYARVYSEEGVGVVDLYTAELVRPPLVQAFERGSKTVGFSVSTGEKHFQRLDCSQMVRVKMPRSQWVPQSGVYEKAAKVSLENDDADSLPLLPSMVGGSMLFPAEPAYNNLISSLTGLVGQRWIDSIDEQMVTVNINDMTREQSDRFLTSIKTMLLKSKELADKSSKNGSPILERVRHIIPVFGDKQLTSIQQASAGRSANITIDDVMLHARLMAGAVGVDLSMLGFADQLSGGLGDGGFFRTSAQVAERARVIRQSLAECFNSIIDIHTFKKYGFVFPAGERPWAINFFGSISALEAERQRTKMDGINAGSMLVQCMLQLKELGFDVKTMESYLTSVMMLDEKQAEMYAFALVNAKQEEVIE
ncbi:MAG: hypothetical protein ACRCWB_11505 [Enterovibrio sp.]